ncbi:MAG: PEP-CTERM sorting domain-containing protein [Verrucomicrobiota bacterium]
MKKLILSVACVLAAVSAYAQGTVNFANVAAGLSAPVFDIDGTTKIGSSAFLAQLYVGDSAASLTAVPGTTPFLGTAPTGTGFFTGGTKTLTQAPGSRPFFQVKAWAASGGATYEAALAAGVKTGQSTVFQIGADLGGGGVPAATPATLVGLTGFSLVPEPSVIALGILGAAALLIRRRK